MHRVETIVTGKWRENCYVVSDDAGVAIIIDPGDACDKIRDVVRKRSLTPRAILNTHGHFDHVGAVAPLASEFSIPFHLHSGDLKILRSANLYRTLFDGAAPVKVPEVAVDLASVTNLAFGSLQVAVLPCPGHTRGSVALLVEGDLFTGDTILDGQPGRTDLPGGDPDALAASVERLLQMAPELRMLPGHGRPIQISDLRLEARP